MPRVRRASIPIQHMFSFPPVVNRRMPARRSVLVLLGLVAVSGLTACSGSSEPTAPSATPAAIRASTGNSQSAVVASALATPLAVVVTDKAGSPVSGIRVEWDASAGSGFLSPATATTNSSGVAQTTWTLGTKAGSARVTATVGGLAPVVFTATANPAAAAAVIALPELANLGLGDTVRVRATVRDQYSNDIANQTIAFASLDAAIAAVSVDGLVTAVAVGNARIVASSGSRADTVPVAVLAAGTSLCGAAGARTLALGEVFIPSPGGFSVSACLGAPAGLTSEYALALISTAPAYTTVTPLDVNGLGTSGPTTAAITAADALGLTADAQLPGAPIDMLGAAPRTRDPVRAAELERRTMEREIAAELTPAARDWQRSGATRITQIADAKVGDIIRLNANASTACSNADTRTSRVAAVGNRVIIAADTANPSGGYTDADYASIAATFDTLVYPLDTTAFGAPSNISAYGKVVLFYTRNVNAQTPANANYTIGGFFFGRDLYPKSSRNGLPACAASNEQEMFYLLVPDPTGLVNNNKRTKDEVTLLNLGTITHELQHLINASRRLYVTPGAASSEETWLDEGLSHVAEELLYFRLSGYSSRQNLTLSDVSRQSSIFTNYASQNFSRFYNFLLTPEISSPYAPNDSLSTRGAIWDFLRFAAGRQGAGGEAAFFRSLVNSPTTGFANLNNATGGQIADYLRDWAVSNIADDYSAAETAALDPRYVLPAWNFRSIYPGLRFSGGSTLGVYPIAVRNLQNNATQRITLVGGTSSYVRFSIAGGRNAQVTLSSNGGLVPASVRYAIVRLR